MSTKRVLVTGATGYIAQQVLPSLREHYDLVLTDVDSALSTGTLAVTQSEWADAGRQLEDVQELDLLADDGSGIAALMEGVDSVVHLAFKPPRGHDGAGGDLRNNARALFEGELDNIDMTQRIYQAALEQGVRRVVLGSSNQASKWYETPFHQGLKQRVGPEEIAKPDNFYGWAKVSYEMLGFLYASGALGRQLEIVALRIVAPRPIELRGFIGQETRKYFRDIAGYISERDMAHLVERSIEAEDVTDEFGVPWLPAYAISNNSRKFWGIENARRVLGYDPQDDSEVEFASEIRAVIDSGRDIISEDMLP